MSCVVSGGSRCHSQDALAVHGSMLPQGTVSGLAAEFSTGSHASTLRGFKTICFEAVVALVWPVLAAAPAHSQLTRGRRCGDGGRASRSYCEHGRSPLLSPLNLLSNSRSSAVAHIRHMVVCECACECECVCLCVCGCVCLPCAEPTPKINSKREKRL